MPIIRFTSEDRVHEVDAREGESLMQAAVRTGVPGIIGECGGELSCATCHVALADGWAAKCPEPSADERDLLDAVDGVRPESRLGCQIRMSAALDGLEAEVVPE
ncbi:2Fe-2S ferredoxin [Actinocorallia herbida]|uniref:2Fe-2S ferredoxin n=1 Tax=Actinocorallia herbida TaxID=58109 RepID=A0A3N1CWJ0_9ACTN|nr:2Fe-2S iron-sulfur cluster-binding protein [Actinocorallia herbida]ROO85660.1 2Fe-2S ferredoxin [Actinocorallia herbida]